MKPLIKEKLKAASVHLICSILLAVICLVLIFQVWYPAPWSELLGVAPIVTLLLLIDVCLGPALTFVVFNKAKASLSRDLLVIIVVQISALVYGLYTIGLARPVYLAYSERTFTLVQANDTYRIDPANKTLELIDLNPWTHSLFGSKAVFVNTPDDAKLRNDLNFYSGMGAPSMANIPQWYTPFESSWPNIKTQIKRLSELNPKAKSMSEKIKLYQSKYPSNAYAVALNVKGQQRMLAILDNEGGTVLGFEPIDEN